MKKICFFISFTLLAIQLCVTPIVSAKLYTWVDKNGTTQRTFQPPPTDQVANGGQAQSRNNSKQSVELYVTSWCSYCKKAKAFFKSKNIAVQVYDIEKDTNAAARKKKLDNGRGGVPFAVINGMKISGFSPKGYEAALNK